MTFNQEIGRHISTWRHRAGLSQETLAEAVGLTAAALSKIENGRQSLSLETFLMLLTVLDLDLMDVADELPGTNKSADRPLWERIDD